MKLLAICLFSCGLLIDGPFVSAAMIGPPGPPGSKGDTGADGQCTCDLTEVDDLVAEVAELQNAVDKLNIVAVQARPLICGVGIRDGRIANESLTASSFLGSGYEAHFARLDGMGFWHESGPPYQGAGEWVQVELPISMPVTGVITQGGSAEDQWVTSYKISYGDTPNGLQTIEEEPGVDMVFDGNEDRNNRVTNLFAETVTAKYFRFTVDSCHGSCALRMEYLFC